MATGIYADKRWPPLRARILRRDDYLCQQCLRYGKHRAATTVHHCFPAGRYPGYAWAAWNLVSLCPRCHDAMHDRNSEQLTPLGEQWRQRAERRKPPPLVTSSAYHPGTGGGDSFQPRRVFGAGGSRGTKATGRTRGNLGGGIFAALRFLRKNESFPAKNVAGTVSELDTKGA